MTARCDVRHLLALIMWLIISPLISGSAAEASAQPSLREYETKALFIFNLIKLTEWPAEVFSSDTSPFVLGVIGKNPFGDAMGIIAGKKIRDREIQVKEFESMEEARKQSHVLFINLPEKNSFAELLDQLQGSNVLTVSDLDGFVDKGGMVGIAVEKKHIIFRLNMRALAGSKVVLPSQVLKLAREIRK
jgi:hypothetical protein